MHSWQFIGHAIVNCNFSPTPQNRYNHSSPPRRRLLFTDHAVWPCCIFISIQFAQKVVFASKATVIAQSDSAIDRLASAFCLEWAGSNGRFFWASDLTTHLSQLKLRPTGIAQACASSHWCWVSYSSLSGCTSCAVVSCKFRLVYHQCEWIQSMRSV